MASKTVYIVIDHPTALIGWWDARKADIIKDGSFLFHIDKHTDLRLQESNREKSNRLLDMTRNQLINFVEADLDSDHSEFIANAMIGDLIGDAISVHFEEGSCDFKKVLEEYDTTDKFVLTSETGTEHNFYLFETERINDVCRNRLIGDHLIHQDTNRLFESDLDMILDIDIDYFTYLNESIYPKHSEDIRSQLSSKSFDTLFSRASVITVALEPRHCGDVTSSLEIFSHLNELVFKPQGKDLKPMVEELLKEID